MIPKGVDLLLILDKYKRKKEKVMAAKVGAKSEKGSMIIGLSMSVNRRKFDLEIPPRWNYHTLVDIERAEEKVFKITYKNCDGNKTAFLSANQMSNEEIRSLIAFLKGDKPDWVPPVCAVPGEVVEEPDVFHEEDEYTKLAKEFPPKPKVENGTKLTGLDMLDMKYKPAHPTPVTESVRSPSLAPPEVKFKHVKVIKTYTVTYEEEFILKFTEKTLAEFQEMSKGQEEDKMVFEYLLRRQTEKTEPTTKRPVKETKPRFHIRGG